MHSNDRLIEHARRRVGLKSALYTHAMVYALVNLGLAALSLYQGRQWFVGPLAGWGLGLLIHAIVTLRRAVHRRPGRPARTLAAARDRNAAPAPAALTRRTHARRARGTDR
jgi:hypothetical protein